MINRAASSRRTDFQRKINAEEIYYNVELCSFQTKFQKTVKDSMSAMKSVEHKVWSMIFLIAMLICFIRILTVIFFAVFWAFSLFPQWLWCTSGETGNFLRKITVSLLLLCLFRWKKFLGSFQGLLVSGTVIRGPLTKGIITLVKRKTTQGLFMSSSLATGRHGLTACHDPAAACIKEGPLGRLARGLWSLERISISLEGSSLKWIFASLGGFGPSSRSAPRSGAPAPRAGSRPRSAR
jgi:hypothetical protein